MTRKDPEVLLDEYSSEIYTMLQALGLESEFALTILHNHRTEIKEWFPRNSKRQSTPIVTAAMAARILKEKYV